MATETTKRGGRARRVRRRSVGSITKRVRERADGTKQTIYRVQTPHPTAPPTSGKKIEKVCYSKQEAATWRDNMLKQTREGTWVDPKAPRAEAPTVADLAKSWERTREFADFKPKTALNFRAILKARVLPRWGDVPAGEVRARDVQRWVSDLHRKGLAPQTTRHAYNVLRAVLKHGVFEGALEVNPCNSDSIALPKMRRADGNGALSLAEMHELVTAMPEHWQLPVELAARFGLRAAELWGVTRRDIDLDTGELHVRQTLSDCGGKLVVTDAKTEGSHRTYALAPHLRDRLAAHLDKPPVKHRQIEKRKVVARGYAALVGEGVKLVTDPGDSRRLVFTTPSGAPVQHSNFYRRVYRPRVGGGRPRSTCCGIAARRTNARTGDGAHSTWRCGWVTRCPA